MLPCEPANHDEIYRSLIASLLGAYKTRALSQNVILHNNALDGIDVLREPLCELAGDSDDGRCEWCENLCKFLPLQHRDFFLFAGMMCLDDETRNRILRSRPGGVQCIRASQCKDVVNALVDIIQIHTVQNDTKEEQEYWEKLRSHGVTSESAHIITVLEEDLEDVDQMLHSCGLKPSDVPKEMLYRNLYIAEPDREYDVCAKSTVERFVARGYPLDPGDLVVLDETKEPLLHGLIEDY